VLVKRGSSLLRLLVDRFGMKYIFCTRRVMGERRLGLRSPIPFIKEYCHSESRFIGVRNLPFTLPNGMAKGIP